jgi:hypothetical protein
MKIFLICAGFLSVLLWRECIHASRRASLVAQHWQEIADIRADACADALEQF